MLFSEDPPAAAALKGPGYGTAAGGLPAYLHFTKYSGGMWMLSPIHNLPPSLHIMPVVTQGRLDEGRAAVASRNS